MGITQSEARGRAAEYGAMYRSRDQIIIECHRAGLPVAEIARLMGIARNVAIRVTQQAARRDPAPEVTEALNQLADRLASTPPPWSREAFDQAAGQAFPPPVPQFGPGTAWGRRLEPGEQPPWAVPFLAPPPDVE